MNPIQWIVTYGCKFGLDILCRMDAEEMKKVPPTGPLIIYTNHTGGLEAPVF